MDKELLIRITDWMNDHRADIVRDLSRLVKIRSVSTYDEPPAPFGQGVKLALDEALALGVEKGFAARNYEDYCGSLCITDEPPFIGFCGHLDVVPEGGNWIFKPFDPIEKDGFLIGRGVTDNKSAVVGAMYVISCLAELGTPLRHNLKLFLGCDEEHGMADVAYYSANYPNPELTLIPDSEFPAAFGEKGILEADVVADQSLSDDVVSFAGGVASNVVPEIATCVLRSSERVDRAMANLPDSVTASRDGDIVTLTAIGKAAHSAYPVKGVNAIGLLTRALVDTHALRREDERIFAFIAKINDTTTGDAIGIAGVDDLSGALTCAGTRAGIRNGRMWLHLNIRYGVRSKGGDLLALMKERCEPEGFSLEVIRDSAPAYFPRENPIVDTLTDVFNEISGKHLKPFVMSGGTYARKLPNALGFGLGGLDQPTPEWMIAGHGGVHEPDEALYIDSYLKALVIFAMGVVAVDAML
ncbi:MAG: Sapep family Mn(2+)-dependent dipeptidase [Oscillospiraceae bacterium]|jgi:succinyl-diaminopimelate desuccinylase|nr:Sapep family Mn(2+)-dependent dipeptidase [Oscillospiraceae bacterium]